MVVLKKCFEKISKGIQMDSQPIGFRIFLGHSSYKTTLDIYEALSIDEMQQEAESKLQDF